MDRTIFLYRKSTGALFFLLCLIIGITGYSSDSYGQNIAEAEYYIDSDPGEGNGVSLPSIDVFDSPEETVEPAILGEDEKATNRGKCA